mgnify:CR=1 FL=1
MSRRSNPFDELERLLERMGRQVEGNLGDLPVGREVAVDVEERDGEYVVRADLPGYERDDIDVELADGTLHVGAERSAETESESETETGRYVRRERSQSRVSRAVSLPGPVEESGVTATFHNGVLTVTLPRETAGDEGHQIDIE